jgi:glycerol uptake facilitator-like aquaporin
MAPKICEQVCENVFKLTFEAIGTCILTMIYQSAVSPVTSAGSSSPEFLVIFLGFFVVLILGLDISGAHYNPAVTVAFMFRRDTGNFPRMMGILYIIF